MKYGQLKALQNEGYQVLLRKHNQYFFIPLKENLPSLLDRLEQSPLQEDEILEISDALVHYNDYLEFLNSISVVIRNFKD